MKKPIIIALGGSIIVPNKINTNFLRKFRKFILKETLNKKSFIIVAGGGKISRNYQKAGSLITKLNNEDKDWIGIHATRLNAHLLRTIFRQEACPIVLDNPFKKLKKSFLKKPILISSGWKPGWSTDYIAVLLAKRFKSKSVIIAGSPQYVYTKDYQKYKKAKPLKKINWKEYQKLISSRWSPGMSCPVDPVAAKLGEILKLKIFIIRGTNLKNLKNLLEGKPFKGTVIE